MYLVKFLAVLKYSYLCKLIWIKKQIVLKILF